ncbi:hypothetical protein QOZ95_002823 [Paenibacillus brasilensis]|uniref:Uncharacterized protein n=1 Tax=Paenibacillus brasilensis TaxID=128574 RepID=A0ABU0KYY5_9BACL|nr:hypothetical protein [Paenibacillus brasilensis]
MKNSSNIYKAKKINELLSRQFRYFHQFGLIKHFSLLYKGQQAPDLLRAACGTAKESGRSIF